MPKCNLPLIIGLSLALLHPSVAGSTRPKPAAKPKAAIARPSKTPKAPKAPAKIEVLQQVRSGPLTLRLRRARWAESEEVLAWRGRGKQLTLWFDALLDPQIVLPPELTPADFIVNVRLLDEKGQAVQIFPVNPVRSLHRASLPYVPAKDSFRAQGQSVWRAQPFSPDFQAVKLQIEWLRPGHPFDRKTLPPSILEAKAEDVAPEARQWLQKIEMDLPQQQVQFGAISKSKPVAQGENSRFKAILHRWRKGSSTTTAGVGVGTTRVYFEAMLLLRAIDPLDRAILNSVEVALRNESDPASNPASEPIKMTVMMGEASQYFAPDGRPLKAHERVLSGSFSLPQPSGESSQWSLELQSRNGTGPSLTLPDLPLPPGFTGAVR